MSPRIVRDVHCSHSGFDSTLARHDRSDALERVIVAPPATQSRVEGPISRSVIRQTATHLRFVPSGHDSFRAHHNRYFLKQLRVRL